MRELGEQWIEIIDGQEHMVKVVKSIGGTSSCDGCFFLRQKGDCRVGDGSYSCPLGLHNGVIKDLGILKDGKLQCPFCGEYPIVKIHDSHWDNEGVKFYIQHIHYPALLHETKQQAIDAWNRRV